MTNNNTKTNTNTKTNNKTNTNNERFTEWELYKLFLHDNTFHAILQLLI